MLTSNGPVTFQRSFSTQKSISVDTSITKDTVLKHRYKLISGVVIWLVRKMFHLSLLHYQNFGIPHPDCQRMPSSHHPVQCLRHEVGYPDSENRAGQFSVSLAGEKLCNPWFQSLELTPKPENPLKHQETSHMLTFHNSEQWPKPHQESLLRDQCGWKRVSPSAAVKPHCAGILRLTQTPLTSFSSHVSIAFGLKTNMKPCSLFQASTVPKSPWASHQPWKSHEHISCGPWIVWVKAKRRLNPDKDFSVEGLRAFYKASYYQYL